METWWKNKNSAKGIGGVFKCYSNFIVWKGNINLIYNKIDQGKRDNLLIFQFQKITNTLNTTKYYFR